MNLKIETLQALITRHEFGFGNSQLRTGFGNTGSYSQDQNLRTLVCIRRRALGVGGTARISVQRQGSGIILCRGTGCPLTS
jgi:hypothetical protein